MGNCRSMESMEDDPQVPLIDFPESCIATILCFTTPRDVARMACVSRAFRDASYSDLVWGCMLPSCYSDILAQASDAPPATCSRKEVYNYLCNRVLLQNGTRDIWIDRASGGTCHSIGARALSIAWGDDERYWNWINREGSRFDEVAYLMQVCWFDLNGDLESFFPPGSYTLSWRVGLKDSYMGSWVRKPVTFRMETTVHESSHLELYLVPKGGRVPHHLHSQNYQKLPVDAWTEIDVGQFTVEAGVPRLGVKFSMSEIDGGYWKSSVCVDSVLIRPTHVVRAERERADPNLVPRK